MGSLIILFTSKPAIFPGILCGLPLGIIKVSWDCDYSFGDGFRPGSPRRSASFFLERRQRFAEEGTLCRPRCLPIHLRFLWSMILKGATDANSFRFRRTGFTSDEAFHFEKGILGIGHSLPFGSLTHELFIIFSVECNH